MSSPFLSKIAPSCTDWETTNIPIILFVSKCIYLEQWPVGITVSCRGLIRSRTFIMVQRCYQLFRHVEVRTDDAKSGRLERPVPQRGTGQWHQASDATSVAIAFFSTMCLQQKKEEENGPFHLRKCSGNY